MKKKKRITWIVMSMLLLALSIMYMVLMYRVDKDSKSKIDITYSMTDSQLNEGSSIKVIIDDTDRWNIDEGMLTAKTCVRYKIEIVNNYSFDIQEWQMTIPVSSGVLIDGAWNSELVVSSEKLTVTPDGNISTIPAGESRTFGFEMNTDKVKKIESVGFEGYRHASYTRYSMFWSILMALVVWVTACVALIVGGIRRKQFDDIRERDANIISQTMETFAGLIDAKDPYTRGHSVRVAYYSRELARRMKFSEEEATNIGYIALMHDCGKIGVPDDVLCKPEDLGAHERMVIKEHTTKGARILENFTAIKGMRDGALYHHERYDGSGYPEGLKGLEIPLCARIIGVADAYDAMSTNRCYRDHLDQQLIVKELDAGRGTQFDPEVVTHMINMIDEGCCQLDVESFRLYM